MLGDIDAGLTAGNEFGNKLRLLPCLCLQIIDLRLEDFDLTRHVRVQHCEHKLEKRNPPPQETCSTASAFSVCSVVTRWMSSACSSWVTMGAAGAALCDRGMARFSREANMLWPLAVEAVLGVRLGTEPDGWGLRGRFSASAAARPTPPLPVAAHGRVAGRNVVFEIVRLTHPQHVQLLLQLTDLLLLQLELPLHVLDLRAEG